MIKLLNLTFLFFLFLQTLYFSQSYTNVQYEPTDEIFSNPERGFSVYRSTPITGAFISSIKGYNVSVVQRIYTIPEFINSALSAEFLLGVESDLNAAREGGVKLVQRFSYTNNQNGSDAPLNIIQTHIEQLKPIWAENYDVIAYVEAGFIGAWGEWYYSSNGLNNTVSRRSVLFSILDALPKERAVVVRTPDYKRKIFEDNSPISLATAFDGSYKSRTGAHNDCFLASSTDFGTYVSNDIEGDKNYLNQDNMFVPQGGETCNPSEFSGCDIAPSDLSRMHWSILNRDYHPTVLNGWKSEGCYDEVSKNLGYRFVLLNGEFPNEVKPGNQFNLRLKLKNQGYASPFNPRILEFVLRETNSKNKYRVVTNEDPRYWFSNDTINIDLTIGIQNDMPEGNYDLMMHLADPIELLHNRPDYSIRVANSGLWEDSTGFNLLNHTVQINNNAVGVVYFGDQFFIPDSSNSKGGGSDTTSSILIDGIFDDWEEIEKFDLPPDNEESGDALNSSCDIIDIWLTDDENEIYISYSLGDSFTSSYFYHIFIDVDKDTSTGFHSGGGYAGIDLMIENDLMWKYNGQNGEWGWEPYGSFTSAIGNAENSRIEISINKMLLFDLGAKNSFDFILNVNELDNNTLDDYAPNEYIDRSYEYNYIVTSVNSSNNQLLMNEVEITSFPNPFNNQINIIFNSPKEKILSAKIYDILGREIKDYSAENLRYNKIFWNGISDNGESVSSGIYIFQLKTSKGIVSTKLMMLK